MREMGLFTCIHELEAGYPICVEIWFCMLMYDHTNIVPIDVVSIFLVYETLQLS